MKKNKYKASLEKIFKSSFLLLVLIMFALSSCQKEEEHSIKVKGKVRLNPETPILSLKIFKVYEDRQEAVDSIILDQQHLNYLFNVEQEGIYSLGFSKNDLGRTFVILQSGKPVEVNFDLEKKKRNFIDASDAQVHKELNQLVDDNKQLYKYLKLLPEERINSPLQSDFRRKQKAALQRIDKESGPMLKQLAAFEYVNYTYFLRTINYYNDQEPLKPEKLIGAKKIFKMIPPESFFWSYNSQLPLMILSGYKFPFTLTGYSHTLEDNQEILDQLITKQNDARVAGYTLIFTLYSFTLSDEKENIKKYTNLYFKRDTLAYGNEITSMFNEFFSPHRKIRAGAQLPRFSITSLSDSTVVYTNSTFNKGVYLIDFWATWCKPCMKEIPFHHKAYEKFHDSRHFDILSISFDRSPAIVEEFRSSKWKMPWKHAILPKGKKDPLAKRMSVSYLPQMILVDGKTNTVIAEMIRLKEGNLENILQEYYLKE